MLRVSTVMNIRFLLILGVIVVSSCAPRGPTESSLEHACTGVLQSQDDHAKLVENMSGEFAAMTDEEKRVVERDMRDAQILAQVMFNFCEAAMNGTLQGDVLANRDQGSFSVFSLRDEERKQFFSSINNEKDNSGCQYMAYVRLDLAESRYLYLFCSEGTSPRMLGTYEKYGGNWRKI